MILTHLLLCCGRGKSQMHCIYSNLHTKMQLRDRAVAHWNNMQCTHTVHKSLEYEKIIFFTSAAALSFMLMYRFESSRSPTWKTHTAYPPAYFYDRTGTMSRRQSTSINVWILMCTHKISAVAHRYPDPYLPGALSNERPNESMGRNVFREKRLLAFNHKEFHHKLTCKTTRPGLKLGFLSFICSTSFFRRSLTCLRKQNTANLICAITETKS